MLRASFILSLVCFSLVCSAQQENGQFIHKHLVRADASIVPGYMINSFLSNVHLNGNIEYYMDNKVSIRGDANYMLGSSGLTDRSMGLKNNASVMLGAVFHFPTKNHFDPYAIIQPGFAYSSSYKQLNTATADFAPGEDRVYYKGAISPLGSAGIGFNYYFQRFAHLFMETRYVHGQYLSDAPSPVSLNELRFTFGLGFNVFVVKEKKKPE